VPSIAFQLSEKTLVFSLHPDIRVHGYSSESLADLFSPLLEGGSFFIYLKEFVDHFIMTSEGGMVLQNFVLAISEFLSFYQSQCNNLISKVAERR
jgi:hypothetical protein